MRYLQSASVTPLLFALKMKKFSPSEVVESGRMKFTPCKELERRVLDVRGVKALRQVADFMHPLFCSLQTEGKLIQKNITAQRPFN